MIIFAMNHEQARRDLEGILGKLSMLSRALGEVDEWLDSRRPRDDPRAPEPGQRVVSLATLDLYLAREKARS
jgi:hypothetical protein